MAASGGRFLTYGESRRGGPAAESESDRQLLRPLEAPNFAFEGCQGGKVVVEEATKAPLRKSAFTLGH